ncbi:hypothetical protein GGX14DRAFT_404844 [Mycena pura]|uniref:Uncharacterized protein n=1 Tax=Mycena pura TaxID=153505 RepID=A0AAD6UTD4_9AGAR|nr:hypothetical protein GGX14DRAFT_404844 [Mycena pura]
MIKAPPRWVAALAAPCTAEGFYRCERDRDDEQCWILAGGALDNHQIRMSGTAQTHTAGTPRSWRLVRPGEAHHLECGRRDHRPRTHCNHGPPARMRSAASPGRVARRGRGCGSSMRIDCADGLPRSRDQYGRIRRIRLYCTVSAFVKPYRRLNGRTKQTQHEGISCDMSKAEKQEARSWSRRDLHIGKKIYGLGLKSVGARVTDSQLQVAATGGRRAAGQAEGGGIGRGGGAAAERWDTGGGERWWDRAGGERRVSSRWDRAGGRRRKWRWRWLRRRRASSGAAAERHKQKRVLPKNRHQDVRLNPRTRGDNSPHYGGVTLSTQHWVDPTECIFSSTAGSTYTLRAIIYLGGSHYTTRVFTEGQAYEHDGRKNAGWVREIPRVVATGCRDTEGRKHRIPRAGWPAALDIVHHMGIHMVICNGVRFSNAPAIRKRYGSLPVSVSHHHEKCPGLINRLHPPYKALKALEAPAYLEPALKQTLKNPKPAQGGLRRA